MDPILPSPQMCLCSNSIRFLPKPDVSWPSLWHSPNVFWCVLWPGRKLFPVTIFSHRMSTFNVAFLNLPFLSHHGCQEGLWAASTHSKAGTHSTGGSPEPSQVSSIHETASLTVPTLSFLFLPVWMILWVLCCESWISSQVSLCEASVKHPVGYLSPILEYLTHETLRCHRLHFLSTEH